MNVAGPAAKLAKKLALSIPSLRRLHDERDWLARRRTELEHELEGCNGARERAAKEHDRLMLYPPGHFYSPLPDYDALRNDEGRIFRAPDDLPGLELRRAEQLDRLEVIASTWRDWPYYDEPLEASLRYRTENDYFGHLDALVLFGMLITSKPRRYFEVGSGWSSALALDTRERILDGSLECTFIEPHPERLHSLLTERDASSVEIITRRCQDLDPAFFGQLEAGDILFVDSSHVSKVGSDVNFLFFEVLPQLRPGVVVHVHDVFYPFEYKRDWLYEGRAWNEAYLLHAFLVENPKWEILLWSDYLKTKHRHALTRLVPARAVLDGASIWLSRS